MKTAKLMKSRQACVLISVLVFMLLFGVWYLRSKPATTFTVTIRDNVTGAPVPGIPVYLADFAQHSFPRNVLPRFEKPRLPIPSNSSGQVTFNRPPNTDRMRYPIAVTLPPNWQLIGTDGDLFTDDNVVLRVVRPTPQSSPVAK